MHHPVRATLENSAGWLAQWSSSLATTKLQVAKMGKSSRRESQKKKKEVNRVVFFIFIFCRERSVSHVRIPELHAELLKKRPEPVFSAKT